MVEAELQLRGMSMIEPRIRIEPFEPKEKGTPLIIWALLALGAAYFVFHVGVGYGKIDKRAAKHDHQQHEVVLAEMGK